MDARRRRILLRVLAILVGGGLLLAMIGFGLFRSDPSWYRRVQLTEAEQAAGQQRLFDRLATLRNEVGRRQVAKPSTYGPTTTAAGTFEIEISEDELNGVLMRWGSIDARTRALLESIDEPHVRFLPGHIEFAGRSKDLGSIVSIAINTYDGSDGRPRVQLGRPWAGRLPLARSIVEVPARRIIAKLRESKSAPKAVVDSLDALIAGDEVTPVVPLMSSMPGEGLLPARVEKLVLENGTLKATLRMTE